MQSPNRFYYTLRLLFLHHSFAWCFFFYLSFLFPPVEPGVFNCCETKKRTMIVSKSPFFYGSPCWTRTNDPIGQKHSRLARLERVAMLVVSSCSEHRFICRRQRGAPSQLTVVVTRTSNSVIRFHAV